jgi:acyl-CoA synthetase (NDP forming)/RimJ/RimL family protein N-acetyltransferase
MTTTSEPSLGEPSPWESTIVLGNGDTAIIRPLVPDDRDALAQFHRSQSADSIYRRYFSPKPELTTRDLDHFTEIDMVDRVALVVESRGEFVAWSSYERWPGRNEAEAAFMVADDHQGEGIATLMLEHLAAIARSNGIERFTAEVLADNRPMLAVFAKAGWPLQRRFESGVVDLDWELATTEEFLDSVERREQRGDSRAVARILLPRAIAVIGASQREGSVGAALWRHVASSVTVPKYAVNPSHRSGDAYEWCATVDELPDDVSLAIIAVPAEELDATIDACIRKRMRGAVVVTAVDGSAVDVDALVARARRNGLRIIGPSSMGIASPRPESLLQAALVDVALPPGRVAISMQSGSLGSSVLRQARDLQLGLSWFVSLGDKADISANDLLQFWEEDANTSVVGMYTESFGNPRKFARIARRVSLTMPIVAVRTGAASVGSLGGALYQQAGLIEVSTVPAMLHTVRVLATQPYPRGPHIAVLTNSRSPGTLARAALQTAGLVPVDGPITLDWRSTPSDFKAAVTAALADEGTDGVLVIHAPAVADDVDSTADDIDEGALGANKPVVAIMLGGDDGPLREGSAVPAFAFPEQAAAVLGRAYAYGQWLVTQATAEPIAARIVDPDATRIAIDEIVGAGRLQADTAEQERILRAYGISFAPARTVPAAEAVAAADELGYPVAIKATRRRPGRSVRSGVALDVTSASDVDEVVSTMVEALGSDADQLIVQAMATPGIDLRIHCELDDRLGVIVSVGLGGAQADVIADRTSRLAPVSPAVAATMLDETRIRAALADTDIDPSPIVDAIVQAAQLASDHGRILELDLNPVIAAADGVVVTDAIVRLNATDDVDRPLRTLD